MSISEQKFKQIGSFEYEELKVRILIYQSLTTNEIYEWNCGGLIKISLSAIECGPFVPFEDPTIYSFNESDFDPTFTDENGIPF